jgi:diguanylate cyclase (GGDEF)-like protein
MIKGRFVNHLAVFTILVAAYFVSGKLGLCLAFVHPSATVVWPPTGIALAVFLILGYRVWPAIFVGALLVNLTTRGSVSTSIGIGIGNTLEGLVGAYLVNRFAEGRDALAQTGSFFRFTLLAAILSTTVSATFGVTSLSLGGFARWEDFGSIWPTWWLGDVVGALVVAPFLLAWSAQPVQRQRPNSFETALLLGCLLGVSQLVFGGLFPSETKDYPLEFLCIPFLLWAAFRLGQRETATALVLLSASAIWGTLRGFGPFVQKTPNESLLLLQAYMGVASIMSLMLAAVVSEREDVVEQLRRQSVCDPLTGIANYRQLIDRLQREIERSKRTARSFAVLLLDLDGLKKINDQCGHLAGNRALCRVAAALRFSCRAIDTPARFGGDEFALVLPETNEEAAWDVGRRISDLLAADNETPLISVSLGVAIYPRNGETAEALFSAADRSLYDMKSLCNEDELKSHKSPAPMLER